MAKDKTISTDLVTDKVDVVVGSQAVISNDAPEGSEKTISTDLLKTTSSAAPDDRTKTVDFKVKYDKDYKGVKLMEEGSVQAVAPDVAELFEKNGLGKTVK